MTRARRHLIFNGARFAIAGAGVIAAAAIVLGGGGSEPTPAQASGSRISAPGPLFMQAVATTVIDREPATPPAWATPRPPRVGNADMTWTAPSAVGVLVVVVLTIVVSGHLIHEAIGGME